MSDAGDDAPLPVVVRLHTDIDKRRRGVNASITDTARSSVSSSAPGLALNAAVQNNEMQEAVAPDAQHEEEDDMHDGGAATFAVAPLPPPSSAKRRPPARSLDSDDDDPPSTHVQGWLLKRHQTFTWALQGRAKRWAWRYFHLDVQRRPGVLLIRWRYWHSRTECDAAVPPAQEGTWASTLVRLEGVDDTISRAAATCMPLDDGYQPPAGTQAADDTDRLSISLQYVEGGSLVVAPRSIPQRLLLLRLLAHAQVAPAVFAALPVRASGQLSTASAAQLLPSGGGGVAASEVDTGDAPLQPAPTAHDASDAAPSAPDMPTSFETEEAPASPSGEEAAVTSAASAPAPYVPVLPVSPRTASTFASASRLAQYAAPSIRALAEGSVADVSAAARTLLHVYAVCDTLRAHALSHEAMRTQIRAVIALTEHLRVYEDELRRVQQGLKGRRFVSALCDGISRVHVTLVACVPVLECSMHVQACLANVRDVIAELQPAFDALAPPSAVIEPSAVAAGSGDDAAQRHDCAALLAAYAHAPAAAGYKSQLTGPPFAPITPELRTRVAAAGGASWSIGSLETSLATFIKTMVSPSAALTGEAPQVHALVLRTSSENATDSATSVYRVAVALPGAAGAVPVSAVLRLRCNDAGTLHRDIVQCVDETLMLTHRPRSRDTDVGIAHACLCAWLRAHPGWVVILDGVAAPSVAAGILAPLYGAIDSTSALCGRVVVLLAPDVSEDDATSIAASVRATSTTILSWSACVSAGTIPAALTRKEAVVASMKRMYSRRNFVLPHHMSISAHSCDIARVEDTVPSRTEKTEDAFLEALKRARTSASIVTGAPGSGKSTLLQSWAHAWACDTAQVSARVTTELRSHPILALCTTADIVTACINMDSDASMPLLLSRLLKQACGVDAVVSEEADGGLRIDEGRLLWLVDGVDALLPPPLEGRDALNVYSHVRSDVSQGHEAVHLALRVCEYLRTRARVLVTCRPSGAKLMIEAQSHVACVLRSMEEASVTDWLQRAHGNDALELFDAVQPLLGTDHSTPALLQLAVDACVTATEVQRSAAVVRAGSRGLGHLCALMEAVAASRGITHTHTHIQDAAATVPVMWVEHVAPTLTALAFQAELSHDGICCWPTSDVHPHAYTAALASQLIRAHSIPSTFEFQHPLLQTWLAAVHIAAASSACPVLPEVVYMLQRPENDLLRQLSLQLAPTAGAAEIIALLCVRTRVRMFTISCGCTLTHSDTCSDETDAETVEVLLPIESPTGLLGALAPLRTLADRAWSRTRAYYTHIVASPYTYDATSGQLFNRFWKAADAFTGGAYSARAARMLTVFKSSSVDVSACSATPAFACMRASDRAVADPASLSRAVCRTVVFAAHVAIACGVSTAITHDALVRVCTESQAGGDSQLAAFCALAACKADVSPHAAVVERAISHTKDEIDALLSLHTLTAALPAHANISTLLADALRRFSVLELFLRDDTGSHMCDYAVGVATSVVVAAKAPFHLLQSLSSLLRDTRAHENVRLMTARLTLDALAVLHPQTQAQTVSSVLFTLVQPLLRLFTPQPASLEHDAIAASVRSNASDCLHALVKTAKSPRVRLSAAATALMHTQSCAAACIDSARECVEGALCARDVHTHTLAHDDACVDAIQIAKQLACAWETKEVGINLLCAPIRTPEVCDCTRVRCAAVLARTDVSPAHRHAIPTLVHAASVAGPCPEAQPCAIRALCVSAQGGNAVALSACVAVMTDAHVDTLTRIRVVHTLACCARHSTVAAAALCDAAVDTAAPVSLRAAAALALHVCRGTTTSSSTMITALAGVAIGVRAHALVRACASISLAYIAPTHAAALTALRATLTHPYDANTHVSIACALVYVYKHTRTRMPDVTQHVLRRLLMDIAMGSRSSTASMQDRVRAACALTHVVVAREPLAVEVLTSVTQHAGFAVAHDMRAALAVATVAFAPHARARTHAFSQAVDVDVRADEVAAIAARTRALCGELYDDADTAAPALHVLMGEFVPSCVEAATRSAPTSAQPSTHGSLREDEDDIPARWRSISPPPSSRGEIAAFSSFATPAGTSGMTSPRSARRGDESNRPGVAAISASSSRTSSGRRVGAQ